MGSLRLNVNGDLRHMVTASRDASLLSVLQDDLGTHGLRHACGLGICGACTVLLDGQAVRSCAVSAASVEDARITTPEGGTAFGCWTALQSAFIAERALQCGHCSNGLLMQAAALLTQTRTPDDCQIEQALGGHLCGCGSHPRAVKAVQRVIGKTRPSQAARPLEVVS